MKAKFIRKYYGTGYEKDIIYLEYEYKNHTYTITENRAKGNEPLSWQHRLKQNYIDKCIKSDEINAKRVYKPEDNSEVGFDMFLKYLETNDESVFD